MQEPQDAQPLGRVVGLWRYPVKSMAAESLTKVEVGWHGLAGDRRWAFVRDGVAESGFPWLTQRERDDLGRYRAVLVDPTRPDQSRTLVHTPSGASLDVTDPELAKELRPEGARVIRQDRGVFDAFPISVITTGTLRELGRSVGTALDPLRFRPNLLVDAPEQEPFVEDSWVGCGLRIGTTRVRVDKRDGRCVVITRDPVTGERNPDVLRAVAREREGCLGVYGSVVQPGQIAVEDPVFLEGPA